MTIYMALALLDRNFSTRMEWLLTAGAGFNITRVLLEAYRACGSTVNSHRRLPETPMAWAGPNTPVTNNLL